MIEAEETKIISGHYWKILVAATEFNKKIEKKDVVILRGKYKGRRAQIQYYYFDRNVHMFAIEIYQLRGKGFILPEHREKFISAQHLELVK